ncbi:MAG TPA: LysM peptidoglycan-binding domain-containing protein [Syntrophales bacterium]|nr:LysM peptidoglycan-binding domain-containing protein [Syntrophales bacterium]HPQ45107.1 LysM peptidoglycan-binding domain-containing protein [Syntrophales bacterium]
MGIVKRLIITAFLVAFLSSCYLPPRYTLSPVAAPEKQGVSVEHIATPPPEPQPQEIKTVEPAEKDISEEPIVAETEISSVDDTENTTEISTEENAPQQEVESNGKDLSQNNKQAIMDEAIDFLGQAQLFWEKGELDKALKLLDEAYSLLLDVNGDPEITWQKDDLRVMIAKKVVEIYASRSNVASGYQSEIPLVMNDDVNKAIQRFQRLERNFFISSYKRSGRYRPMILKQLKEAGLPEELSWLPLVESGFKIQALSKARALGLWQIIPSTGYRYGLKRDHWIDERMDPEKSTEAAIAYLKELHGIFGDWLTVLAAYNCGEGRVLKAISRQQMNYLDNFWDLYRQLPPETSSYVPRYLATLHILKDPGKFGIDLNQEQEQPVPFVTVTTEKSVRLKDVAQELQISEQTLHFLNSELRYKTTPNRYDLKIPKGMGQQFTSVIDKIVTAKRPGGPEYIRYKVKKGDTLSGLASRYKSSINAIMAANHLSSKHSIREGNWLKIPSRGYVYSEESQIPTPKEGGVAGYRVKKGDSLWLIARRFDTTVSEIKKLNGLWRNDLTIGQIIKIRSSSAGDNAASSKTCVVEKGDTLSAIAHKNGIDLDTLLKLNSFDRDTVIHPGQQVIVR